MTDDPISKATPVRLAAAAKAYGLKENTLRTEARRGNLAIFKIGNRHYTTPAEIERMIAKCRVQKEPISGSGQPVMTLVENSTPRSTSSVTAEDKLALDAALMRVKQLKEGWRRTSPKNINQPAASVHYLKSKSPT